MAPGRDEDAALRRSLRKAAREVAECIGGADAPRRLADLQDRTRAAERRLTEAQLRKVLMDRDGYHE